MMLKSWCLGVLLATAPYEIQHTPWNWNWLLWDITRVIIYVFLGLAIFAVAYLILDKATPFSFGQELRENKNTAMAIVLASVFLGIALILAAAIRA
jgi:uncharacterized membrane protein YjfL (UPF0719 family)